MHDGINGVPFSPRGVSKKVAHTSTVTAGGRIPTLSGQKLADRLTIRDMHNAPAFRCAIERQIA